MHKVNDLLAENHGKRPELHVLALFFASMFVLQGCESILHWL